MRFCVIALCSLTLAAGSMKSLAQEEDGAAFLRVCGATVRSSAGLELTPEEASASQFCTAYISGYLDSAVVVAALLEIKNPICLPKEGVLPADAAQIFVKYLRENPAEVHRPGKVLLMVALRRAFPCG